MSQQPATSHPENSAAQQLQALAVTLGVDATGWAVASVPQQSVSQYHEWLAAGNHAKMSYLERQLATRAAPASRLTGLASVLVLGVSHAFKTPIKPIGGVRVGRVARYAWTPDYHEQLQPILTQLEQAAADMGVRARGYIDHGPIMERLFAAQGFLGWRGKSGMLISTSLGAFVTLAVLLTDLPLDPPASESLHPDRCGRCSRCLDICPTSALLPNRTLDARRCLSYLTIEHRGPIDHQLRPLLGDWLFGCDLCSEICPWSNKAGALASLLVPHSELAFPDLSLFFGISERQFGRLFAGSAFLRARRKGMARNALMVLSNTRAPEGWPLLLAARQDVAWEVREAAAWALGQWQERAALLALESDPHEQVRATVQHYL